MMNKIYKNCLAYAAVSLLLFGTMTGVASASVSIIGLATSIMQNHQIDNDTEGSGEQLCLASGRSSSDCPSYTKIGQGICLSGGRSSSDCPSYTKIGQGLCLAGGRSSSDCPSYTTIAQGICLSSGRSSSDCPSYTTTGQGLCLAKGHSTSECSSVSESTALSMTIIDVDGAWDSFYDEYHNTRWMCRGRSTAQFVDAEKCAGKTQIDDTWSGM
jgi:hypothetical protein